MLDEFLDMPYAQVDNIAKMIPQELNITLDGALKQNRELKNIIRFRSRGKIPY